jgi:Arc/MetJ-type ribon-helix-helix transcriptional regulator
MVKKSIHLSENDVMDIETLVERGDYLNVSDAIRSFTRAGLTQMRMRNEQ